MWDSADAEGTNLFAGTRTPESDNEWIGHLSDPAVNYWLAYSDDDCIGVLECSHRGGDYWPIGFWVDPGHRGQGTGGDLLRAVIDWAENRDDVVYLEAQVDQRNSPCLGLFRKDEFGFRESGGPSGIQLDPYIFNRTFNPKVSAGQGHR